MGIFAIIGACIALLIGSVSTSLGHPYVGAAGYLVSLVFFGMDILFLKTTSGVRGGHTLFLGCLIGAFSFFGYWIGNGLELAIKISPLYFAITWGSMEWIRRKTI